MKKLRFNQFFNHLGLWTVPLVSVTAFPFILGYWQPSETSQKGQDKDSDLPPLSQIQTASVPKNTLNSAKTTQLQEPRLKQPTPVTPKSENSKQAAKPEKSPTKKAVSPSTTKTVSKTSARPSRPPKPPQRAFSPPPADYQPPPLEIRVAILRNKPKTIIGASDQATILDRDGKPLKTLSGNQGWSVQPNGSSLSVGNGTFPGVIWVKPTAGNLVYVGDRWYRGKILLVSQGSKLLAVNYVDLEHYLYSVVGSEMHANAPTEALKAQAIAARSYALVHMIRPASSWFDLGNTQRWQVYKGLNSEYNTGHHAVQQTSGQILSHKGGVVESLYAATDEIVARAHSGRGMSQTGAYKLAKKGYDYQQILDYYYPGTSLARLVLNN
ncbi:MAG TPA: sporulation protein SpoIID [Cyanothece sp. UBA12306]|nr:sporulation protein SpoIID [Cyanothece sp. UBA12306]